MWESLLELRDRPPVQFRAPPAGVVHPSQSVKYDYDGDAIEAHEMMSDIILQPSQSGFEFPIKVNFHAYIYAFRVQPLRSYAGFQLLIYMRNNNKNI
jgi:hypothetical protein